MSLQANIAYLETPSANDAVSSICALPLIPLIYLNAFAGLVGGIGLVVRGEWASLGYGIILLIVSPMIVSILLLTSILFLIPSVKLLEQNKLFTSRIFLLLGSSINAIVLLAWAYTPFWLAALYFDIAIHWTTALWCYQIAITPIAFLASKTKELSLSESALMIETSVIAALSICWSLRWIGAVVVLTSVVGLVVLQLVVVNCQFKHLIRSILAG